MRENVRKLFTQRFEKSVVVQEYADLLDPILKKK
jgi:hypothetical protein